MKYLKTIGIPLLALAAMLTIVSARPADAAVRFGVQVGPPVYPGPYAYPYSYYDPYYGPYAYPYSYGYAYPYGYANPTTEASIGAAVIGNITNMNFADTDFVAANTGFGAGDSVAASMADIAGKL
jgi:hypothetical protein